MTNEEHEAWLEAADFIEEHKAFLTYVGLERRE